MSKLRIMAVLLLIIAVIAISCAPAAAPPPKAAPGKQAMKVALLLSVSATGSGFGQTQVAALEKMKKELGAETAYTDLIPPANFVEVARSYAGKGYNFILFGGQEFADAAKQVAPEFPKITFATLYGTYAGPPNQVAIDIAIEELGFLVGTVAGLMTKSNKIAVVSGIELPVIVRQVDGFKLGVNRVNPKAEVIVNWVGSFTDPAKGKEGANAVIGRGVDFIWALADDTNKGIYEAIKGTKVMAAGWAWDENPLAPQNIVTSALANQTEMEFRIGKLFSEGKLEPKSYTFTVKDPGIIDLAPYHGLVPKDVEEKVAATRKAMEAGEIKVPLKMMQ